MAEWMPAFAGKGEKAAMSKIAHCLGRMLERALQGTAKEKPEKAKR
jgi:hypothetical protein